MNVSLERLAAIWPLRSEDLPGGGAEQEIRNPELGEGPRCLLTAWSSPEPPILNFLTREPLDLPFSLTQFEMCLLQLRVL